MPTLTTTDYYSVNGQIIGEKVGDNPRVDYLTDALGSVTATVDQTGHIINEYRYKPYGALLSKTGSGPDPAFRWVGSRGYRSTGLQRSDVHVRERHYSSISAIWNTRDRTTMRAPYAYVRCRPTVLTDPSGLKPVYCDCGNKPGFDALKVEIKTMCDRLAACYRDPECRRGTIEYCLHTCGVSNPGKEAECMFKHCTSPGHPWQIHCKLDPTCTPTACYGTYQGSFWGDCETWLCAHWEVCPGYSVWDALLHELSHCCGTEDPQVPGDIHPIGGPGNAYCVAWCLAGLVSN